MRNAKQAQQELLKLETATLPRLVTDEENARTALLAADEVLEGIDAAPYNGYDARRRQSAELAVGEARAWHTRARRALEKAQQRRARLLMLLAAA